MYTLKITIVLSLVLVAAKPQYPWSKKLKAKVENTVTSTFSVSEFILEKIIVDDEIEENTKRTIEHNLYRITNQDTNLGYLFVDQTPSMKDVFDFAVIFSNDLKVLNTKVLIYREQHGRQIGAKRWLKQFLGLTPDSRPQLGKDIDGISGATISANSMTNAMHDLLVDIQYLDSKELLSND